MPEHNFEQQARDMANGFEMEPKPEVWQNVRNAIQQPQRKRRFALWWLLPLLLIGGSVTLFTLHKADNATQVAKTNTVHQPNIDEKTTPAKQLNNEQQTGTKKETKREDSTTSFLSENNNLIRKQSTTIKAFNSIANEEKTGNKTADKRTVENNKVNEQATIVSNELNPNSVIFPQIINDENRHVKDSTIALNNQMKASKDSLKIISLSKDSTSSIPSLQSDLSVIKSSGSSAINTSDSSRIKNSSGVKKLTSKLHWGIIAEGGISTRKSSMLSFAGLEKSSSSQSRFPGANDQGSGVTGSPGGSRFHYNNTIQHGAAFGVGVALQKKITSSIDVFADAAYHYQSLEVATTAYRDSLVLNNSFTSVAGSYKATQAFHFASLFAGINWHFINTKHVQLGISAGADNLFLIAAHQNMYSISGSNFSSSVAIRISDSVFTKNNFYQYQPSLFAGVLFTIKKGNQQLQLIPFARSSFRPFDKYTTSGNNHLFSAGLRAVYFFK
jgi:hypothetical protein